MEKGIDTHDVLRARRIEVVDEDDVVRASIYCVPGGDDCAYVELATPKHNGKLFLFAFDGGVGMQAWSKGNEAVSAYVGLGGDSSVHISDPRTMEEILNLSTEAGK